VLVAFILAYLTAKTWFDGQQGLFDGFLPTENPDGTAGDGTIAPAWDDYLVLLGGPFAALVFARDRRHEGPGPEGAEDDR
jgi:hypothetical protein